MQIPTFYPKVTVKQRGEFFDHYYCHSQYVPTNKYDVPESVDSKVQTGNSANQSPSGDPPTVSDIPDMGEENGVLANQSAVVLPETVGDDPPQDIVVANQNLSSK